MAAVRGTSARLLIDEFDFSGATNSITISAMTNVLDPTNLSSAGVEKFPGLGDGSIEHGGFYSGKGAGQIEQELHARLAGGGAAYVAVTLGAAGDLAYVLPTTWLQQLQVTAPVADLITLQGTWPANANLRRGRLIYRGALSATGAQAYVDFSGPTTEGGLAWLFVQSITGTAVDAELTVQSDDNTSFLTPATEATFTFSDVGVQAATLVGTIDRYIRLNVVDLGGADAFTVACIVALSGINF